MLELYEQNRLLAPQGGEVEGSAGGGTAHRAMIKGSAASEEHASKQTPSRADDHSAGDGHGVPSRNVQNQSNDNGSGETGSVITDHKADLDPKEHLSHKESCREVSNKSKSGESTEAGDGADGAPRKPTNREGPVSQSPLKIDKDKVKAALEKRRKSRGETTKKKDIMDEDDLIEKELEDGIELAVEDEKSKKERRQSLDHSKDHGEVVTDRSHFGTRGQSSKGFEADGAEEGEMVDKASPMLNSRKRKAESTPERHSEGKKRHEYMSNHNHDSIKEHRRHAHENHL